MNLVSVGLDNDIGGGLQHLKGRCLVDGSDFASREFRKGLYRRGSLGNDKLLVGSVIRVTEEHFLSLVGSDLDTADHTIVETTSESRNETVPAVLDELWLAPHVMGYSANDFVLESGQPIVSVVKGKRGVTGDLRGPPQKRNTSGTCGFGSFLRSHKKRGNEAQQQG